MNESPFVAAEHAAALVSTLKQYTSQRTRKSKQTARNAAQETSTAPARTTTSQTAASAQRYLELTRHLKVPLHQTQNSMRFLNLLGTITAWRGRTLFWICCVIVQCTRVSSY